jgi:hypothetical protein
MIIKLNFSDVGIFNYAHTTTVSNVFILTARTHSLVWQSVSASLCFNPI